MDNIGIARYFLGTQNVAFADISSIIPSSAGFLKVYQMETQTHQNVSILCKINNIKYCDVYCLDSVY